MTSPSDNEIIEGVQKAIWEVNNHAHIEGKDYARAEAEAAFAFLEPLITKRAEEAVLRKMLEFDAASERDEYQASDAQFSQRLRNFIRAFSRAHGINLEGDTNAQ